MAREKLVEQSIVSSRYIKKIPLIESNKKLLHEGVEYDVSLAYEFPIWRLDTLNLNNRIYTKALALRVIKENKTTLGLADHPSENSEQPEGSVKNICFVERNPHIKIIEGQEILFADIYLVGDHGRKTIKDILDAGGGIGLSSSAFGEVLKDRTVDLETFELERYADHVLNPSGSVFGFNENKLGESVNIGDKVKYNDTYWKIEKIDGPDNIEVRKSDDPQIFKIISIKDVQEVMNENKIKEEDNKFKYKIFYFDPLEKNNKELLIRTELGKNKFLKDLNSLAKDYNYNIDDFKIQIEELSESYKIKEDFKKGEEIKYKNELYHISDIQGDTALIKGNTSGLLIKVNINNIEKTNESSKIKEDWKKLIKNSFYKRAAKYLQHFGESSFESHYNGKMIPEEMQELIDAYRNDQDWFECIYESHKINEITNREELIISKFLDYTEDSNLDDQRAINKIADDSDMDIDEVKKVLQREGHIDESYKMKEELTQDQKEQINLVRKQLRASKSEIKDILSNGDVSINFYDLMGTTTYLFDKDGNYTDISESYKIVNERKKEGIMNKKYSIEEKNIRLSVKNLMKEAEGKKDIEEKLSSYSEILEWFEDNSSFNDLKEEVNKKLAELDQQIKELAKKGQKTDSLIENEKDLNKSVLELTEFNKKIQEKYEIAIEMLDNLKVFSNKMEELYEHKTAQANGMVSAKEYKESIDFIEKQKKVIEEARIIIAKLKEEKSKLSEELVSTKKSLTEKIKFENLRKKQLEVKEQYLKEKEDEEKEIADKEKEEDEKKELEEKKNRSIRYSNDSEDIKNYYEDLYESNSSYKEFKEDILNKKTLLEAQIFVMKIKDNVEKGRVRRTESQELKERIDRKNDGFVSEKKPITSIKRNKGWI